MTEFPCVVLNQRLRQKAIAVNKQDMRGIKNYRVYLSADRHSYWTCARCVVLDMKPEELGFTPPTRKKSPVVVAYVKNTRTGAVGKSTGIRDVKGVHYHKIDAGHRKYLYWRTTSCVEISKTDYYRKARIQKQVPKDAGRLCKICGQPAGPNYFYCRTCHRELLSAVGDDGIGEMRCSV